MHRGGGGRPFEGGHISEGTTVKVRELTKD